MTKPFCDWLCQDANAVDAFSNEEEFEKDQLRKLKAADCMSETACCLPCLTIPLSALCCIPLCCICISSCVEDGALCNPPDARKLSEEEAKPYIDGLQGG